jgi:hypothetical protein
MLDTDSTDFRSFLANHWLFLFFTVSASKLRSLLITTEMLSTNQIHREFDSNVAIRTFEILPASKFVSQKTNFLKPISLPLRSGGRVGDGGCSHLPQTESKGNFCLITVYSHKNFLQPQNYRARKQTFSNFCPKMLLPRLRGRLGGGSSF